MISSIKPPAFTTSVPVAGYDHNCSSNPFTLPQFVTLYEHMWFGGDSISLGPSWSFPDLTTGGWNDITSSVTNWHWFSYD